MKKRTYMIIDLCFMAVIMCVLEFATGWAKGFFIGEAYIISCVLPVFLISVMRWGLWGIIHGVLGGIVYALINAGSFDNIIIYTIGGLGAILAFGVIFFMGREKVRLSVALTLLYCIAGWLGIAVFRTLGAMIITGSDIQVFARFLLTDSLSAVIAIMAVFIARAQNGLFEDQNSYLLRLQKEEKDNGK